MNFGIHVNLGQKVCVLQFSRRLHHSGTICFWHAWLAVQPRFFRSPESSDGRVGLDLANLGALSDMMGGYLNNQGIAMT